MKMTPSTTRVVIFFIMVVSLALGAQSMIGKAVACETNEQGWEIPDLEGLEAELAANDEVDGKIYKREAFVRDL